jgi:hypothetical protein
MKREFIPYEQALELKELGFEEPCFGAYVNNVLYIPETERPSIQSYSRTNALAPLYQQAFRWFRKKHELSSWIYNSDASKSFYRYFYTILFNDRFVKAHESADTYEEAELACLRKLIEIVKHK